MLSRELSDTHTADYRSHSGLCEPRTVGLFRALLLRRGPILHRLRLSCVSKKQDCRKIFFANDNETVTFPGNGLNPIGRQKLSFARARIVSERWLIARLR